MGTNSIRYNHIAITVADMKRSVAFYRDLLGCEVLGQLVLQDGNFQIVYLQSGPARIELFALKEQGRPNPGPTPDADLGFKHICFEVDDVDRLAARLKENGVEFLVEPKKAATSPLRLAFFADPDGNKIEITSGKLALLPVSFD